MSDEFMTIVTEGNIPKGIFEVHLIVKPNDQALLFAFYMDKNNHNEKCADMRPTLALSFYGKHPCQPMLTFYVSGSDQDAISLAKKMSANMEAYGMTILRLKVEAMAHNKYVQSLYRSKKDNYFEFHFKISITNLQEWNQIRDICLKYGAHLFFNPYSKKGTMYPVVTLRRYDVDLASAEQECDDLIKEIKAQGFDDPINGVQREYSILDTNVYLDEGWLFNGNPRSFIYKL